MSSSPTVPDKSKAAAGKPSAENRASFRKVVSLKAKVLLPQGQVIEGRTQDLSTGGVGLLLRDPLTPMSQVQVAIQLPKPKIPGQFDIITGPAKVVFQVMRSGEFQVGAQWLSLDGKTLQLLQAFTEHASRPKVLG